MKYCTECGTKLIGKECINFGLSEGIIPYCPKCEDFRFPRFNVAVSAVIFNMNFSKILLIQQYNRPKNILVAGYVNKGENLSHALIREIKEEVGLEVEDFQFNESQYYEKSDTLICNFLVRVKNEDFKLSEEVDSACWYGVNEAKEVIYKGGLAEEFLSKAILKINNYPISI